MATEQQNPEVEEDDEIEVSPFDKDAADKIEKLDSEEDDKLESEKEDVLDILEPKADPKLWQFNSEMFGEREYTQQPLKFMAKMEWFSLVGEVLDKAMSGPNALSMANLFSTPQGLGQGNMSAESFREADTFVQAVGKLVAYSPDFLQKSYAIWLGVKKYEREIFYEMIDQELSDEDGFEILNIFIDQNWEAIQGFFGERISELRQRVAQKQKK